MRFSTLRLFSAYVALALAGPECKIFFYWEPETACVHYDPPTKVCL